MNLNKQQLFIENKINSGKEVAKYSYFRWLLFNYFIYERNGAPKFDSTKSSYKKIAARQVLMNSMFFLSLILLVMFMLRYSIVFDPLPSVGDLEIVHGELVNVDSRRYGSSISIVSDGKVHTIGESLTYLFKDHLGEKVTVYYGYSAKILGRDYIYYAFSDDGDVILDYDERVRSAKRIKKRAIYYIAISSTFLLLFILVPFLLDQTKKSVAQKNKGSVPLN